MKVLSKIFILVFIVSLTACTSVSHVKKQNFIPLPRDKRLKVAIVDFKNVTDSAENDKYIPSLSQTLQADLFETKTVRIIERERMESILKELSLSMQGLTKADSRSIKKIGEMLNADALLFGNFLSLKQTQNKQTIFIMWTEGQKTEVNLSARLVDVETGEVIADVQSSAFVKQRTWVAFGFARLGGKLNREANTARALESAAQDLAQKIAQEVQN